LGILQYFADVVKDGLIEHRLSSIL
jgi:hypothetical protein